MRYGTDGIGSAQNRAERICGVREGAGGEPVSQPRRRLASGRVLGFSIRFFQ